MCAFSLHPGNIAGTGLSKHLSREELRSAGSIDENGRPVFDTGGARKTVEQGAATGVWCATSQRLTGMGGVYCENVEVARLVPDGEVREWTIEDSTRYVGVMPYAVDPEAASRLWNLSEHLTGKG